MNPDDSHHESSNVCASEVDKTLLDKGMPLLTTLYFYITNYCNLACRHCWISPIKSKGDFYVGEFLDLNLLKTAIAEGKKIGLQDAKLTGGEPVLHPHFIQLVDILSASGVKITMETNATLIDDDLADYLKKNTSIWFISTSLDHSDPIEFDAFRGVQGAFNSTVRGIESLVRAGFNPQIIMCLHRGNMDDIEKVVDFAIRLGAGSVKFNPVTPAGRGAQMEKNGETLDYSETMRIVRFIRGELQDSKKIPLSISMPPALSPIKDVLKNRNTGGECRILNTLGILGDGTIALCGIGRNIPEMCFGKLGRDELFTVWKSNPVLIKLRQELNGVFPGICGDCIHASRCLTRCIAMNYLRTGELITPDYFCLEAEKRGEFPDSRRKSFPSNQGNDEYC